MYRVRMRTLAAAALVAAGIASGPAAATSGAFIQDGWNGFPVFKDEKFVQCQMWMQAINNWDLGFAQMPSGELRIALRRKSLDLGMAVIFGERFSVRLQLDDGPVVIKPFAAVTATSMSTTLKDLDWDKKLPNAEALRINNGRLYRFDLKGIKPAMGLLQACVAKNTKA